MVVLGALTVVGPFAIDMYLPALPTIGAELAASPAAATTAAAGPPTTGGTAVPNGTNSTPTITPVVKGDQRTLVILANFTDKALTCTAADVNTFGMWCCMMADFSADPSAYPANKTGQLRALAEHFGMTPAARARLKVDGGEDADKEPNGPERFFAN